MLKIKLLAMFGFLFLVGFMLFKSNPISAENEFFDEIAKYKTWTKVSKDPIKVEFDLSSVGG